MEEYGLSCLRLWSGRGDIESPPFVILHLGDSCSLARDRMILKATRFLGQWILSYPTLIRYIVKLEGIFMSSFFSLMRNVE